jgi:hypothetical protein
METVGGRPNPSLSNAKASSSYRSNVATTWRAIPKLSFSIGNAHGIRLIVWRFSAPPNTSVSNLDRMQSSVSRKNMSGEANIAAPPKGMGQVMVVASWSEYSTDARKSSGTSANKLDRVNSRPAPAQKMHKTLEVGLAATRGSNSNTIAMPVHDMLPLCVCMHAGRTAVGSV